MSKQIMTVQGPIKPEELGYTDMHEHIMFDGKALHYEVRDTMQTDPRVKAEDKVRLDNVGILHHNFCLTVDAMDLDDEEVMCGEVQDFKDSGGDAILELSAVGIRLDIEAIRRISQKTGVHVIGCTGFYVENKWPEEKYHHWTLKDYRDFMLREVKDGIDGTGILPGHLKIGMSTFSPQEEQTLRAAAQVSNETGLSLTVHPTHRVGGDVRKIVQLCKEEGMDTGRLVIAHMGGTVGSGDLRRLICDPESFKLNLDYCRDILNTGATISFEFMSGDIMSEMEGSVGSPDWLRLAGLRRLIQEGYASQLVLGTDLCVKIMARRYGGEGYCRMTRFAVPALQKFGGVSDYAIRQITHGNPARILAY